MKWLAIFLGLVAIAVMAIRYIPATPDMYLVAQEVVPVYMSEKDAVSLPTSQATMHLAPSQRVKVIDLVDVKHYQIYKVRMQNGETGFINDGKYSLKNGSMD